MRLTMFSDYCLRALMYVGAQEQELSSIGEITETYGISRHHVTKVVHRLGRLGYLQNVRGKGGGIRLARDPAQINIGIVIREIEGDMDLVECFRRKGCCLEPACVLRTALGDALFAFLSVLDGYTLADLLRPKRRLKSLFADSGFADRK